MIFFGLCLGDSGYGLFLFLGATAYRLLAKKVTPSMKSILSLIQVLAVSTFFCGLLTGTFFGANIYDLDWPIVQRLKHAVLMDNNDMFQLSLILGAIQILFGMVLKESIRRFSLVSNMQWQRSDGLSCWFQWLFRLYCRTYCRWEVQCIWLFWVSPVR